MAAAARVAARSGHYPRPRRCYINRNDFVADGREANRQWWTVFFTGLPEVSGLNLMQMFQQIGALPPLGGFQARG